MPAHRGPGRVGRILRAQLGVFALAGLLRPGVGAATEAAPPAQPSETVRLTNGSVLVGRVLSRGEGRIHLLVDGIGVVAIDSTALAAGAASPMMSMAPRPWSGNLSVGVLYVSEIAPGLVGTNLGVEITSRIARELPGGNVTLDGTLGYSRVEPVAATIDQWGLVLGFRHDLPRRFLVLGTSRYDVNRVQYLEYRSTTLGGIGYAILKQPRWSFIVAPGVGYSKSEQTPYGRVLSFGNRQPPSVEGMVWGVHDMLMAQLTPTIMLEQNALWLEAWSNNRFREAQLVSRLTGAVTSHLKMLIVYSFQYDNSMPAPVKKAVQSLNSGIQLGF